MSKTDLMVAMEAYRKYENQTPSTDTRLSPGFINALKEFYLHKYTERKRITYISLETSTLMADALYLLVTKYGFRWSSNSNEPKCFFQRIFERNSVLENIIQIDLHTGKAKITSISSTPEKELLTAEDLFEFMFNYDE